MSLNDGNTLVKGIRQKPNNTPSPTVTPSPVAPAQKKKKTPYQLNVSEPVQTPETTVGIPGTQEIYAQIWKVGQTDPEKAKQLTKDFISMQSDPASPFYQPYKTATNRSVQALNALGVDTSNIDDNWFQQTADLEQYLRYDGTTNAPSKPGKKASDAEKAAYERYQIGKANDLTKSAQSEWAALQEEIDYWTRSSGRNYSDDEIMDKIYGKNGDKLAKKYPTLAKMDASLQTGKDILELNTGIGYSRDNVRTAIWRSRNDGGTGDWDMDALLMATGQYNGYVEDPDIVARRTDGSEYYAPYSLGSTMDEACVYYGQNSFTTEEIANIKPDGSDATEAKMWNSLYEADLFTIKAEDELAEFNAKLDKKLETATDPEKVMKDVDRWLGDKYKSLKSLDDTAAKVNSLKDTTRAIDYSYNDVLRKVQAKCAENKAQPAPVEKVAQSVAEPVREGEQAPATPALTPEDIETAKVKDQNIQDGYEIGEGNFTPAEEAVMKNAGSSMWDYMRGLYTDAMDRMDAGRQMVQNNIDNTSKGYVQTYLQDARTVANYNTVSDNYAVDSEELAKLQEKYGDLADYYTEIEPTKQIDLGNNMFAVMSLNDSESAYVLRYISTPSGPVAIEDINYDDWFDGFEDLVGQAQKETEAESKHLKKIKIAQLIKVRGGAEFEKELQRYGQVNVRVENEKKYLKEHDAEYGESQKALDAAEQEMSIIGLASSFLGADTTGLENARAMSEYLLGFVDEPPLPRSDKTKLEMIQDAYHAAGKEATKEDISQNVHESEAVIEGEIQFLQEMMDYIDESGMDVPANVRKHMQFMMEDYQNELQGFRYAEILTDTDPEELNRCVEAGKKFEAEHDQEQWVAMFGEQYADNQRFYTMKNKIWLDGADFINEDDENTYYYLLGKKVLELGDQYEAAFDGEHPQSAGAILEEILKDGNDYLDYMYNDDYGVWTTREKINREKYAQGMVDSGFLGAAGANILGTLSTPVESILSAGYMLDRAISGKRINPDSQFRLISVFKEAARGETTQKINETFGEGSLGAKLANLGYEIYCNRGDSMMNSLAFGWMFGGVGGKAGEFLGASPMGATAALNAAAEAVENGASTEQAWLIAGATFLAETVTEAITLDDILGSFGTTKELSSDAIGAFIKDWLVHEGRNEVIGEVSNDIIENWASEFVAMMDPQGPYASDNQRVIDKYISEGKTPDEAKALATADRFKGYLHTALVSYLSAGTDVFVKTGKAAINSANYYRTATRAAQQLGDSRSMLQHMLDDHKANKEARQNAVAEPANRTVVTTNNKAETGFETEDVDLEFPVQNAQAQQETADVEPAVAAEQQAQQEAETAQKTAYAKDLEVLTSAMNTGATESATAGISAILAMDKSDASMDMANAASVRAGDVFSGGIGEMRSILAGGGRANVDNTAVKVGMMQAILGGENSASYQLVQSEEFQNATDEQKAQMLAETGAIDAQDQNVQQAVNQTVQETRIAENTRNAIGDGMLNGAREAKANAERAADEARQAQEDLTVRQSETQAADDARVAATQNAVQNPGDLNALKAKQSAEANMRSKVEVEQEYEQRLQKAEEKRTEAERKAKAQFDQDMATVRGQSQEAVAQADQQRAEAAAQEAETQRIAEEQQAQAQAEEDQRSGKADEDKARQVGEDAADKLRLTGQAREEFIQRVINRNEQNKLGKIDLNGQVSNAEGYLAVGAFARKTGMKFELSDSLPEGTRGAYKNGTVYLNANLVRNGNMTVGQALVEASLHEITHSMEQTRSYRKYRDTVLDCIYGSGENRNNALLEADIKNKIEDYEGLDKLTREGAIKEIVADFARNELAKKDTVQRFMDAGMGGKMRNALHNINQALKNFFGGLSGDERRVAENFRKAERLFQKALNQVAKEAVHPQGGQFSVAQFAQAAGMTFNEADRTLVDAKGNIIDGVNNKITPDMVKYMPVGRLISAGLRKETISEEKAAIIQEQFAGLLNMCARYKDTDMIWEIAASTLDSQFSAIKSNSDKQYSTTVDFGTICAKTQAIVDQLSRNMLTLGRGLTINEILDVYNDVYGSGLSVPCPVCYVFSRWMGVPSLLNAMKDYQDRFLGKQGEEVPLEETQRRVDDYVKTAQGQYGIDETFGERVAKAKQGIEEKMGKVRATIATLEQTVANKQATLDARQAAGKTTANAQKQLNNATKKLNDAKAKLQALQTDYDNVEVESYGKAINKVKTKLDNDVKNVLDKIDGGDTGKGLLKRIEEAKRQGKDVSKMEDQLKELRAKEDELNKERAKVDGYNWVTQALCYLDENGRFVVDKDNFERTPDEILFDLNRTAEFSKYGKNWKYRSTRGAGMGKAILPYSGASLGDSVYGKDARIANNALLAQDYDQEAVDKGIESAMRKARQQNLIGGQRFQSTSDFRPEWGLDYIMTFIEQQAIGSCGQLYTKVAEAVPLFAKAGIDTNLSVMPFGDGYHIDENGEVVLEFSDVTGMDVDTAIELKNQYPNVQLILVGINDTHILAALKDGDIDFVIPWHSSGNSRDQLSSMMSSVKEQLNESSDYTKLQSDVKYEGETALVNSAKEKIENGEELTKAETNALKRENNRNIRKKILTGEFNKTGPTAAEMDVINGSQYLQSLYNRFYVDETSDCYGVEMTASQASQIFPYEYWQTDVTKPGGTKATADENGRRFCEYCKELGYIPRFSGRDVEITNEDKTKTTVNYGNFSGMQIDEEGNMTFNPVEGYWKLLIDRSMYDLDGNYRSQQKIDVTNINVGEIETDQKTGKNKLTGSDLNREDVAKKQKNRPRYRLDNKDILEAHKQASKAFDDRMKIQHPAYDNDYQFSAYGDITDADIDQMLAQASEDYDSAVARNDMATAEEINEFFASQRGFDTENKAYHGTDFFGFTEFDLEEGQGTIFVAYDKDLAATYSRADDTKAIYNANLDTADDQTLIDLFKGANERAGQEIADVTVNEDGDFVVDFGDGTETYSRDEIIDGLKNFDLDYAVQTGNMNAESYVADRLREGIYGLYTRPGNQLVIDGEGKPYGETPVPWSDKPMTTREIAEYAKANGYDSVRINNIVDRGHHWDKMALEGRDIGIFFNENDVKSADPITKDNNGNIINPKNRYTDEKDLRYSAGGEMTDADIDQALAQMDNDYMSAVNSGDMDTAQKMVDEAAKKAFPNSILIQDGEFKKMWHHTNNEFTEFLPSISEGPGKIKGIFFTPQENGSVSSANTNIHKQFYLDVENLKFAFGRSEDSKYVKELRDIQEGVTDREELARINKEFSDETGIDAFFDWQNGWYTMLDPAKIKSADPITYDNNGNIIPLSERFNKQNPDIRYSTGGQITDADIDQMLAENGLTPQLSTEQSGELPGMPAGNGKAQRQYGHETAQGSDAIHQEVKDYLYTHSDYDPETNQEQIGRAMDWVRSNASEGDEDGYRASLDEVLSPGFDYRSADGQARMLTVMGMAALKAESGDNSAMNDELRIADAFNRQGTDLGRQLQARKIFRLMTPLGRRQALLNEVNRINTDFANRGKDTQVHLSDWTMKAAESAQTEQDFEKVQKTAEAELASQIPANWKEKLQTWRMLSMLGNPRTHIRNVIGNAIFVPTVGLKNAIATVLENKYIKEGERTKAVRYTDDAKAFAKQDVKAMKDVLTGEAKYSPENRIDRQKKAFGQGNGILSRTLGRFVQGASDFNSFMLEAEDWVFLNKHYQNALASYMTANGLTSESMTGKTLEKARQYAILEAQKATYRDANEISDSLNKISRGGGVKGFLLDTVLPFKKTPANILRRGIEYSPVGLVKSFATAKRSVDLYNSWAANGFKGDMPKGAKTMNQALDSIAAGMTGTMISALGMLGYALGAVKLGFGKEDDDELEQERGSQEYSIELFGQSLTIDWAAPVCMPFFLGASLWQNIAENNGDITLGSVVNAVMGISEPVFNLSMLDGVNSLLETAKYSTNKNSLPIGDLLQKIGANYVGSMFPALGGAWARTIDNTRRKNFIQSGDELSIWSGMLEQAQNKIPGLSFLNIPYRNVWGEADVTPRGEAFLENFVLPGYINHMKEDKLVNELQRIYDQTKNKSVIPTAAGKTVGGIRLTDKEYDKYVVTRGQTAKQLLNELIERPEFIALTPTDVSAGNPAAQIQLIGEVWKYANAVARYEVDPEYDIGKNGKWIAGAYARGDAIDTIFANEEAKAQTENAKAARADLVTAINGEDADAIGASVEALKRAGKTTSQIKDYLYDDFRDAYKEAYLNDDDDTMERIKTGLMYADLGEDGITEKIFTTWEKAADKTRND